MMKFVALILLSILGAFTANAAPGDTIVAKWKYNTAGAFTMSFDDSMETQARIAMPAVIERGLVGTWFINPGTSRYQTYLQVWEVDGPKGGQEYANHTWQHIGARTYQEADYQIGKCARYIWNLRGGAASKLLAFSQGGGTTWNITDMEMETLMQKYHCIRRSSDMSARTDLGVDVDNLIGKAHEAVNEKSWIAIHFHGIGGEWLPIDTPAFVGLLDYLAGNKDKLWSAGWGAAFQYAKERDHANVEVLERSATRIRIRLITGLYRELYAEPLTLLTEAPDSWSAATVMQDGRLQICHATNGRVQYEAIPDGGEIVLQVDGRSTKN
jgi:hypothetical protein